MKKAAALGLEPKTESSQVADPVTGCKTASRQLTHGLTHDPDLLLLAEHWYDYPEPIRRQLIELSRSWPQEYFAITPETISPEAASHASGQQTAATGK